MKGHVFACQEMKLFFLKQYNIVFEILEKDFFYFSLLLSIGDAPYCTPEQYKECADPALGKELITVPMSCVFTVFYMAAEHI